MLLGPVCMLYLSLVGRSFQTKQLVEISPLPRLGLSHPDGSPHTLKQLRNVVMARNNWP